MTDNVNVTNPIEIQDNSKARVALDLMVMIARSEKIAFSRENLIPLYAECLRVVKHGKHKYTNS